MHIYNMELVIPVHQTWENLLIFFLGFCDKSRSQFFWVLIQLGETTTLFKIPFTLGAGCFGCYCWPGFLPSIFLFLFVLYACPQISVQIYIYVGVYPHKCACTQTCVYLHREGQGGAGLWLDNAGYELQIHEGKILLPPSGIQLKTIKPQA